MLQHTSIRRIATGAVTHNLSPPLSPGAFVRLRAIQRSNAFLTLPSQLHAGTVRSYANAGRPQPLGGTHRMNLGGGEEKPALEQYGVDLTARAKKGLMDPVVGRSSEIHRTIQILSRRTKNNLVLIGKAGTGKTTILEGLAQKIVEGTVPKSMKNKRIISLDLGQLIVGAKFRADFEKG